MEHVARGFSKLVIAAVVVFVGTILLYLASVFGVYVLGWIIQLLGWIF